MSQQMEYTEEFLEEQRRFLNDLIAFQEPLKNLKERDKIGPVWDEQPEGFYLAVLTRQDITSVLHRYIAGELSNKDVYEWAESLDCRESIDYESGYHDVILEALAELSNDYDEGVLFSIERARRLINELKSAEAEHE